MQNASNIGQLLLGGGGNSPVVFGAAKGAKSTGGIGDLLGTGDAFKSLLLGGLAKSDAASALVAKAANTQSLTADITITPDLLAQLQGIHSAQDLQNLPGPLAALLAQHMGADGALDATAQKLIASLAAIANGTGNAAGLTADADVAKLFGQFAGALQAGTTNATGTDDTFSSLFDAIASKALGTSAHVTGATVSEDGGSLVLITDKGNISINAADLTLDQFNAFKKLAFADLAPFLTQQRSVRIDPHTIMKTTQGPSFLDDENAPKVVFIHVAGLAGSIPSGAIAGANAVAAQLQAQADTQYGATGMPVFLDASLIAKAANAIAPKTSGETLVLPQSATASGQTTTTTTTHMSGVSNLFAALLGVSAQADASAQAQVQAQGQTADNAQTVQTLIQNIAGQAQNQTPNTITAMAQQLSAAFAPGVRSSAGAVLKGLDTSLVKSDADGSDLFAAGLDSAFPIRADGNSPSAAASALLYAKTAATAHPATYMVSMAMQRNMDGAIMGADRQFTIQLDPENLGKVKITLEFGDDNTVKAKLIAERPETVALLQKDASALERSLHNSGFDVKTDALSFNLGDNGSFSGSMSQNGNSYQNSGNASSDDDGTDLAEINTVMPIFVDPVTGMTHVNIVI